MARYERRQKLHTVIERSASQLQSTEAAFGYMATRRWVVASTTANTSTPSVTIVSENVSCTQDSVLEVYANGLGTTNGAGKYGALVVYIDSSKMYADSLVQWGSSSAAVTSERRFSFPSSKLGTTDRLGGFVVVMDSSTSFLEAGTRLIEIKVETIGASASCTVTDLDIAYRIS